MNEVNRSNASGASWADANDGDSATVPLPVSPDATPPAVGSGDLSRLQEMSAAARASAAPTQFRAASGSPATDGSALPANVVGKIDDIVQHLSVRSVVAAERGKAQAPVKGTWEKLEALDAIRSTLSDVQLAALKKRLLDAIEQSSHTRVDAELLHELVSAMTERPGGGPLPQLMAGITFERMVLPDLDLDTTGQTAPDSRYFNSALVPLAEAAYDHDPTGRTLLWQGACRLFPGPGRAEKLQKAMFSLPKDLGLCSPMDFYLAVDALQVDELVTEEMIDGMRRDADGDTASA